jgi:RNA polymerase sigma-54 factor
VLADAQGPFLLGRRDAHRPLRRQDVARAVQVVPSTVGRAVAGKHLRCPDGRILPLAACFGADTGPKAVLQRLLDQHPEAGDAALQQLLAADGLVLARRTVAKYRAALQVPARAVPFGATAPANPASRRAAR